MKKRTAKKVGTEEDILARLHELAFEDGRIIEGEYVPIKVHESVASLKLLMQYKGMLNDKLVLDGELNVSLLEQARERAKNT